MVNFAIARAAILGYKLRHLKMYSDGSSESSFHGLRNIVMEHKDLIKYVEEANESLKWYFLGEFIVKSYHISVSISNVMHSNKNILYFLVFILHLLIQVGLVYTRANELSLKSTNLSVEIFKSNWYEQSSKVKRSLLIVMARAQRPLVFTIGNFRVIDIEMFVNMTKAAYTFVLYQKM
ncbi:unnamed protein product [Phaedon cochleariae]|uniref:Odorant receptor n=1 Tax=Phaedon cochleariae TaxID=80249 RepID=A0A9N9SFH5_PHACE|nr:unnamed protein product [Phaedon cochleariae]